MLKRLFEIIIMVPIAILGLLLFIAVEIINMIQGKQTADEDWQHTYVDSNMNHGQGPLKEDK